MRALPDRVVELLCIGVRRFWFDLVLLVGGIQFLVWMAHPDELVAFAGPRVLAHGTAFQVAVALALAAFALLSLRYLARLLRAARRVSWDPALRAEQGTVMAEFALVLPVVLMMLGTVFQIALIANAALVVRYAAFAAARSAMVSFEADMPGSGNILDPGSLASTLQAPPLPEWVDRERPAHAASLVLASISPRVPSGSTLTVPGLSFALPLPSGNSESAAIEQLIKANGTAWDGGEFASRVTYARLALTLQTIGDKIDNDFEAWHDSVPPLIPMPEHAVQPQRLRDASPAERENLGYLVPSPPDVSDLIPDEIEVEIEVPLPGDIQTVMDAAGIDNPSVPFPPIPLSPVKSAAAPLLSSFDDGIDILRNGAASGVRTFARSGVNVDFVGPKEVEITLTYAFKLNMPSILQLVPDGFRITEPAPVGGGRAFRIQQRDTEMVVGGSTVPNPGDYTVRLQSTGGRRNLLGIVPKVPDVYKALTEREFETVSNTPLYFRLRGETKADEKAAEKKKKADEEAKKKAEAEKKRKEEEARNAASSSSGSTSSGSSGSGGGGGT